ncbi:Protein of unknown function [Actinobaculum suis]|uniref:DUF3263 domain-containing protein n=1 Tax=Actinobaculum suis TaxID=1657 RepID=A0A1B9BAD4_9ACTO|nr:DUF3263 domain-containing protein [Actinobaculum suis]MDY5153658.1 DUF3263 domain-containing protein [Actinobaculum suis]OCA93044.1 hypothetical protein ACU21_01730 [Actinobaculum suis]OCA93203.1 hypothetical protein ACU20_02240 [Actinobaculum suis]SDE22407.1 Protein of unknown function [Actinobaculum suis]
MSAAEERKAKAAAREAPTQEQPAATQGQPATQEQPAREVPNTLATEPLTAAEQKVLHNEKTWRSRFRRKAASITALGMTETEYYLLVASAVEKPAAELADPELVRRIRNLRAERARERGTFGRGESFPQR